MYTLERVSGKQDFDRIISSRTILLSNRNVWAYVQGAQSVLPLNSTLVVGTEHDLDKITTHCDDEDHPLNKFDEMLTFSIVPFKVYEGEDLSLDMSFYYDGKMRTVTLLSPKQLPEPDSMISELISTVDSEIKQLILTNRAIICFDIKTCHVMIA